MNTNGHRSSMFAKGGAGLIATLLAVVLALCALPVLGASKADAATTIDADNSTFYCAPSTVTYTGEAIVADSSYVVTKSNVVLLENRDYTVKYSSNTNVGTAQATVTYKNSYTGEVKYNAFAITALDLSKAVVYVDDRVYTGKAITLASSDVKVVANGMIIPSSAYEVSYPAGQDQVVVGQKQIQVKPASGATNYTGIATGTFNVVAADFLVSDIEDQTYTGSDIEPSVTVTNATSGVELGSQGYAVKYKNNVNVGLAAVEVTATSGNYAGASMTKYFAITAQDLSKGSIGEITARTYTGQAITPAVTVTVDGKTLSLGKDYVVSYENNVNAGTDTATVTVTGIGNYSGTLTKTFTIEKADIASCTVYPIASQVYTGAAIEPALTVTGLAGEAVELGAANVTYSGNKDVGTASATITSVSNSNYTVGTTKKTVQFQIVPADGFTVAPIDDQDYTGSAITPTITVKNAAGTGIAADGNYTVQYFDNTDAGVAKVVVTGIGGYAGSSFTTYFNITAQELKGKYITVANTSVYTGSAIEPAVTVAVDGKKLVEGTDYVLSYLDNVNAGNQTARAIVTGIGNYAGTAWKLFTIDQADLSSCTILPVSDQVYTGEEITPDVVVLNQDGKTLVKGTDYTVQYSDNTNAGTAKITIEAISGANSNYKNSTTASFNIVEAPFTVEVNDAACYYTGTDVTPDLTVKSGTKTLEKGTDYTVTYDNNVNAGLAVATVTGKGSYEGTLSRYFTIQAAADGLSIDTIASQTYTGSAIEPAVSVTAGTTGLVLGKDYVVSYAKNVAVGTATATVTGIGNYAGTASENFTIVAADIADCTIFPIADQIYMGGASIEPALTIQGLNGASLKKGTDYDLLYSFNNNVGTATVTVTGMVNYLGSETTATFNIVGSKFNVAAADAPYNYGAAVTTTLAFTDVAGKELILTEGTDYTVKYWDNTDAGVATVQVTGKGNYAGSQVTTFFTIAPVELTDANVAQVYSQTYTGNAIEPALTVTAGGKTLEQGTDYTVSYKNNTDVTANNNYAYAYVAGTGNYTGTAKRAFEIKQASLKDCTAVVVGDNVYTGSAIIPSVVVTNAAGNVLEQGTDYTVACSDKEAGPATATITAAGSNYADSTTAEFAVLPASFTVEEIADVEYTGAAAAPEVTVKNGETTLVEDTDYEVTYTGEDAETWGIATITGKGNYAGTTVQKRFWITKASLGKANVTLEAESFYYNGSQIKPAVTDVQALGGTLIKGKDYVVAYGDNVAVGTGTVTIYALEGSNFAGSNTVEFAIDSSTFDVKLFDDTFVYTGFAIKPALTVTDRCEPQIVLTEGVDYTATFEGNVNVTGDSKASVKVVGMGGYAGTVVENFEITAAPLSACTILPVGDQVYTGEQIQIKEVTVIGLDGTPLVQDTNYSIKSYGENKNVGEDAGTVTVAAIENTGSNYEGEVELKFDIVKSSFTASAEDATYSVEGVKPAVTVKDAKSGNDLEEGEENDYTYTVEGAANAGVAVVEVTGVNNYAGSAVTTYFTIAPRTLTDDMVSVETPTYTGKALAPTVTVKDGDVELQAGIDYTVSYTDGKAVVKGAGNYTGTVEKTFTVGQADMSLCTVDFAVDRTYTYTGSAIEPAVIVRGVDGAILTKGKDYEVGYSNNTNACTDADPAVVTITAAKDSNYTGTITKQFVINPAEFTVAPIWDHPYTGGSVEPDVVVKNLAGNELTKDSDYTLLFSNNIDAGSVATATVTGNGNYAGTKTQSFAITNPALSSVTVSSIADQLYTGAQIKPAVTVTFNGKELTEGTDYVLQYGDNVSVGKGTVTILPVVNSIFTGKKTVEFNIVKTEFTDTYIKIADIDSYEYTGAAIVPDLTVTNQVGNVLTKDVDYTVSFESQNTQVGNVSVKVTGKGGYTDQCLQKNFAITRAPLSNCIITAIGQQVYTGKQITPEVSVIGLDGNAIPANKLNVAYGDNTDVGEASGTVTIGADKTRNYAGTVELSFDIVEAKFFVDTIAPQTYTGAKILCNDDIAVYDASDTEKTQKLEEGTDYTVALFNNTSVTGEAVATITGINGYYKSTITTYFDIVPKELSESYVTVGEVPAYTGQAVEPYVTVKDSVLNKVLQEDVDYTVRYMNNVNPGESAKAIVTGTGNYTGKIVKYFTIAQPSLADCVIAPIDEQTYTGSAIVPALTVTYGGTVLKQGVDYKVELDGIANVNYGDAKVKIVPGTNGIFTGEQSAEFQIVPTSEFTVAAIDDRTYTGSDIEPTVVVKSGSTVLSEETDYDLTWANNKLVGEATVTVTGTGNYTGEVEKTFRIAKANIQKVNVAAIDPQTYTGSEIEPEVTVTYNGTTVGKNQYSVSYSNNVNVGDQAVVTITANADSNFKWEKNVTFSIVKSSFSESSIEAIADQTFTGDNVEPKPVVHDTNLNGRVLTEGIDYTLTYSDNLEAGNSSIVTITGINNYAGITAEKMFTIAQLSFADCTIDPIGDQSYTGSAIELDSKTLVVRNTAGKVVDPEIYNVSYEKNKSVGEATVTVTAKNFIRNYFGGTTASAKFNIVASEFVVANIDPQPYTGTAIEPKLTVTNAKDSSIELREGTDYTVQYTGNVNAGSEAHAVVTGIDGYEGSVVNKYFTITKRSLSADEITVEKIGDQAYTGGKVEPAVVVKDGEVELVPTQDYTVQYGNNINPTDAATVQIIGKGNYTGTLNNVTFKIIAGDISTCAVDAVADQTYTGKQITPALTVRNANRQTLVQGIDYEVTYDTNVDVGENAGSATIEGIGAYAGASTKVVYFNIVASNAFSVASVNDQVFTGKGIEPKPAVTFGGKNLVEGEDFTYAWSNNVNAGSEAIVAVTGKGNFTGTVERTFKITKLAMKNCTVEYTKSWIYTGKQITPSVVVKDTVGNVLVLDEDYAVSYGENVNVGAQAGTITLTALDDTNLKGSVTVKFDITTSKFTVDAIPEATFTGDPIKPVLTVRDASDSSVILTEGVDYEAKCYGNFTDASHGAFAYVVVKGLNGYAGYTHPTVYFKINQMQLSDCTIDAIADQIYDGEKKTPDVILWNTAGHQVVFDNNFKVTYEENIEVGTATVTVEVINESYGNYVGKTSTTFKIVESTFAVAEIADQTYTGDPLTPALTVTDTNKPGKVLTVNEDYTVEYYHNVDKTEAAMAIITGINGYEGHSAVKEFDIVPADFAGAVIAPIEDQEYTGGKIEPTLDIKFNNKPLVITEDYVVSFDNNINLGVATATVTGKGNFTGTKTATFNIVQTGTDAFRVLPVDDQTFTGSQITPTLVVNRNGNYLKEGTDYKVEYGENIHVGKGTATVIGLGSYEGMVTGISFNIVKLDATHIAQVTVDPETNKYTGEEITPDVLVKVNDMNLVEGTDFTVEYLNNIEVSTSEPNAANLPTVVVTFKGDYEGTAYATFVITVADCIELSGIDRYETATLIAKEAYPTGASVAILTTGLNFPDALAASSYAGMRDCPILLTEQANLTPVTSDALTEMGVQEVIIVGGTDSVSERVKYSVRALGISVSRIEGADRYATADSIYSKCMALGNMNDVAIIATGVTFADALSVSGYAFMTNSPIFLVNESGELTATAKKALADGAFNKAIILGGEASVPSDVDAYVESTDTEVIRLQGVDRYATNLKISQFCLSNGMTADGALIATGMNFPDALAGGVLAGKTQSIMILADDQSSQALGALTHGSDIRSITFLGGTDSVSKYVRNAAMRAAGLI